ncbi:MAG: ABC transporter permease [Chloroflexota bacterium]
MSRIKSYLKNIISYPSAVVGIIIILGLGGLSIYTVVTIPYSEAIDLWRGSEDVTYDSPKNAAPVWFNLFTDEDLPPTIIMNSRDESLEKSISVVNEDMTEIVIDFTFDYPYAKFPQEVSVFFEAEFAEKFPSALLTWLTPDGREIRVGNERVGRTLSYRISQDEKLIRRLDGQKPEIGLFADPNSDELVVLPGTYTLRISTLVFEDESEVDAEMVIYGKVQGLAGTDHRRRDLMVALMWGTPIALSFGLLAAVGTTVTTMIIAGIGTWYSGWVDEVIQRITEVNLILPVLPILIMIGTFYSKSIWLMLGVIIILSIFGGAIKTYRAVFLQVKESPYIEAAKAYGASDARIIFRYLIPRMIPLLIPQLVVLVPSFVFLEASLSVLGLGDPVLPTWGKVINDARTNGALYQGNLYWLLEPAFLLMLTGLAFAMVGFSLDRIFNPRLRDL